MECIFWGATMTSKISDPLSTSEAQGVSAQENGPAKPATESRLPHQCDADPVQAFYRDLPQLLQERPGQWVAYYGNQQLGFGATSTELYRECLRRGLAPEDIGLFSIEPAMPSPVHVSWPAVDS
jgi:hypothetical protein